MGQTTEYFYRLENYILCMLIARRAFNTGVISGETYDLIENEMSKEFLVKKSLYREFFKNRWLQINDLKQQRGILSLDFLIIC